MMFECIDKVYPSVSIDTVSGAICTFTDTIGGLPLKSCTSLISGYQEGSGTPSPDNIRPLHAFSSATLDKTKKNLFDYDSITIDDISFPSVSGYITRSGFIYHLPSGVYTITASGSAQLYVYMNIIGSDGTFIEQLILSSSTPEWITNTFTLTKGDYFIIFSAVSETPLDISSNEFMIEAGSTATDYEPYNGNTYTFTFGQDIYQGSIDWKRGVVTATWGYIASYNGETLTGEWLCDKAPYEAGTTPSTGSQVAYELATPIEIPLVGVQLLTQEGQNNIFCDTGDTTVEYIKIV